MRMLNAFILAIAASVIAVTNEDFNDLEVALKDYFAQDPDRRIPLIVRNTFHDLFLQNQAGYHGCIIRPAFFNDQENAGLDKTNNEIEKLINDKFPNVGFSFGDVIAFSGKVAVETAYPCVKIDFKFNRESCDTKIPVEANAAPSAFLDTIAKLQPMLGYLGGNITDEDMAILFAGAHGIKGARCGPSGWFGVFATVTSGKAFIEKTFSSIWKGTSEGTLFQYFTGDTFDPAKSIIRLPTDMIFFPSKIPDGFRKDRTPASAAIEAKLKGFLDQDRSVFDNEFARVFTKMLKIGNGNQTYVPKVLFPNCPDKPKPTTITFESTSTEFVASTSAELSSTDSEVSHSATDSGAEISTVHSSSVIIKESTTKIASSTDTISSTTKNISTKVATTESSDVSPTQYLGTATDDGMSTHSSSESTLSPCELFGDCVISGASTTSIMPVWGWSILILLSLLNV